MNIILKNSAIHFANVPIRYNFKNIDIFCFYFDEISIMSFNVCPQTQIRTHTNVDFPTSHPPFSIYKWSCHGMVSEIMVQFVNVNVFDSYLSTYLAEWAIQTKKTFSSTIHLFNFEIVRFGKYGLARDSRCGTFVTNNISSNIWIKTVSYYLDSAYDRNPKWM